MAELGQIQVKVEVVNDVVVKVRSWQDWIALGSKPIDLFVVVVPVS